MTEFNPDLHVPVTKEQMAILQRGMTVMNKLWSDPKDGLAFKRKVKELIPDWQIPEVDVVDQAAGPLREELTGLKKQIEDLVGTITTERKTASEKAEETSLQGRLDAARREYQLTDEGMDKVLARMKETNNPDPSSAAAWVTDHMPKAKPTPAGGFGPRGLNLFGSANQDDSWAELHRNPDAWFDSEVNKILGEFEQAA